MYKNKYLKYKSKYLELKNTRNQDGGNKIMEFENTKIGYEQIIEFITNFYDEIAFNDEMPDTWIMFTIGFKADRNFLVQISTGAGAAGLSENFKKQFGPITTIQRTQKFRPFVKVTNDKAKNITLLNIILNSFVLFLSTPGHIICGKFWIKNIELCQCGKFFDFYGNYTVPLFKRFKRILITMCKELNKNGFVIEDRCKLLYPEIITEKSREEFSRQDFGRLTISNYNACKIEYQYFKNDKMIITYRNDNLDFIPSAIMRQIIGKVKNDFVIDGVLDINKFNSALCEKKIFDEIIKNTFGALDAVKDLMGGEYSEGYILWFNNVQPLLNYDTKYMFCPICNSNTIDDDFNTCINCNYEFE
jgi:hypothetical protein